MKKHLIFNLISEEQTYVSISINPPETKKGPSKAFDFTLEINAFTCLCINVQRNQGCVVRYGKTICFYDHFQIIKTTFLF